MISRKQFREAVFARDGHKCVICGAEGQDAHHIMERRLWPDGGYHVDNGATLCGEHHIMAEQTLISPEELRKAAGIEVVLLPAHLYRDHQYDKWGNPILNNGFRARGELYEESRKIVKARFAEYVKYPRTYHLPWSNGTKDDRKLTSCRQFECREVVVTEKMDGENTTMYRNYMHARSIDGQSHHTQSWVRNLHNKISWQIPACWRICGENLFAKHSIHYDNLPSYFMVFSIWEDSSCLSWRDTLEWCELFELEPVPTLYQGIWDEELIKSLTVAGEGYVVRLASGFSYANFKHSVAKYVQPNHVQTSPHWRFEKIVPNQLKGKNVRAN